MPEWAEFIGGLVRWLFKGCGTKLKDEIEGNFNATWGASSDLENFIIGIVTVIVLIGLAVFIFF